MKNYGADQGMCQDREGMRCRLKEKYNELFDKYNFAHPLDTGKINGIIRQSLQNFLKDAKKPAIYCGGGHTQMLMADFMYDLKNVKFIVDNYTSQGEDGGFSIIRDEELEERKIDAVILSTFKFRSQIKRSLKENHPAVCVLDIYDEFEKNGILLQADYYYSNHPYHHYHSINYLQRELSKTTDETDAENLYEELITEYIHIRDFRTAILKAEEYGRRTPSERIRMLLKDLKELYELEQEAAGCISENNVLMLCLDGLRRQDLSEQGMPKIKKILDETAYGFTNAYSYSTSTFESLIPVYSENSDMRTHYFEKNTADEKQCRFMRLARQQKRNIFIYGDIDHYIEGGGFHYSNRSQTVTEKLWDFILDGCEEKNGLFYLHEMYESHFTFSNPYTVEPLKSEGTAMLFDFLPAKGGRLRTDYKKQHQDALRYLDDILEPFFSKLSCKMVIYADHGTLILDRDAELSEIGDMEYVCSEGWTGIPLWLRCSETGVGQNAGLISLMELNSVVVSLLKGENYLTAGFRRFPYIKMGRSGLYNPDFRFLYEMIGKKQYLQAFECFLFDTGYKLIIFENGYTELRFVQDDRLTEDDGKKKELLEEIREEITVCDAKLIFSYREKG